MCNPLYLNFGLFQLKFQVSEKVSRDSVDNGGTGVGILLAAEAKSIMLNVIQWNSNYILKTAPNLPASQRKGNATKSGAHADGVVYW